MSYVHLMLRVGRLLKCLWAYTEPCVPYVLSLRRAWSRHARTETSLRRMTYACVRSSVERGQGTRSTEAGGLNRCVISSAHWISVVCSHALPGHSGCRCDVRNAQLLSFCRFVCLPGEVHLESRRAQTDLSGRSI